MKKLSLNDTCIIAKSHGGIYLSTEYKDNKTPLLCAVLRIIHGVPHFIELKIVEHGVHTAQRVVGVFDYPELCEYLGIANPLKNVHEVFNKSVPKPINLRPEYDLEYVKKYYVECGSYNYNCVENMCKLEKRYNDLAIIKPREIPQQWVIRIKDDLKDLIDESRSLTPSSLPPKPVIYIQYSASASSFIDVDEYWAFMQENARKEMDLISFD
ncbi:23236_t:CDS:2 [Racocetra persica]|uniref:23236_t:CDS:1 n=1 Tax=Racocetra persica TaxID=160502 RepID=A0ACA9KD01_9GLOM|nr:23236_t:CDS:2 [Racocetra persica]